MNEELISSAIVHWPVTAGLLLSAAVLGSFIVGFCWKLIYSYVDDKENMANNPVIDFMARRDFIGGDYDQVRLDDEGFRFVPNGRRDHYGDRDKREGMFKGVCSDSHGRYYHHIGGLLFWGVIIPLALTALSFLLMVLGTNLIPVAVAYGTLWSARQATRGVKKATAVLAKLELHKADTQAHQ